MNKEKIIEVVNLHNKGLNCREISEIVNISSGTIGINLKKKGFRLTKVSVEMEKEIIRLYIEQELSSVQIGKIFKIDHTTVLRYLKINDIKTRKPNYQGRKQTLTYKKRIVKVKPKKYVDYLEESKLRKRPASTSHISI